MRFASNTLHKRYTTSGTRVRFQQNYGEKSIGCSGIVTSEMPQWPISFKPTCLAALTL